MIKARTYIIVICLIGAFFACKKKPQAIPHYSVSKVFKVDSLATINVHINSRLTTDQLVAIAGKLKSDSAKIKNLEIHYLLPGNADISSGSNSYYASATFAKDNEAKVTDTLKDSNGDVVRVKIYGLSQQQAWYLLTLQPKEIAGKIVLGRFIDDYNRTVIIPFNNKADKTGNLYVIEIDSTAKVVSATMPLKVKDGNDEHWLVTQNGDYITLKNDVLTQYGADGLGVPFNSIKSGI
jgi:hypothetical protein